MNLLLSNDDGIHADGIAALYHAVADLGEIHVVAPDTQRSAVGHAITLSDPIKTQPVELNGKPFGYAASGTPADCVKLAVCALLDERPDLVISGINLGPNAGIAAIYSGTVSAATEGTILGIPSMAISLGTFTNPIWDTAAHVARRLAKHLHAHPLPEGTLLNVNVPNIPLNEVKGFAATRMGRSRYVEVFDKRMDPRGNVYYWMDGEMECTGNPENTDLQALADGYVSLTPISFDLTHHDVIPALEAWDISMED
jgi:5'-nucleotidase